MLPAALLIALQACGPPGADQPRPGSPEFAEPAYVTGIGDLRPVDLGAGGRLRVVATTNAVGDVVARVGGEAIDLMVLLPVGADPHGFVATPRQLAAIVDADLVFLSGFGFEEGLRGLLEQVAADVPVVSISEGVVGIPLTEGAEEPAHEGEESEAGGPGLVERDHAEGGVDPHVWFDPTIVMQWSRNAAAALGELVPADQQDYQGRADAYVEELQDLDARIKEALATIPSARRVIVTDHFVFGYFAQRYGFEVVGAVIPAYSSSASASPQDLAALLEAIEQHGVKAVFVGLSANPVAAEALARDAGIQVVRLYTESLGEPDGTASSYIAMMEYNVSAIVEALR